MYDQSNSCVGMMCTVLHVWCLVTLLMEGRRNTAIQSALGINSNTPGHQVATATIVEPTKK